MNAGAVPGLERPLGVTFCAPGDSPSQPLGRKQRRGTRELTNFVTLDERAQARDTVMQTAPKKADSEQQRHRRVCGHDARPLMRTQRQQAAFVAADQQIGFRGLRHREGGHWGSLVSGLSSLIPAPYEQGDRSDLTPAGDPHRPDAGTSPSRLDLCRI